MWNLTSRTHTLNHFPDNGVRCFVKREDELGCGINGPKKRKYASLMPALIQKGIRHLAIIAGPQSNNLLAGLQMAREYQLAVTAFLIKPWNLKIQGNFKLSRLFLSDDNIVWINRDEWGHVETQAHHYVSSLNEPGFVLTEGASVLEALDGATSLAADIIRNEHELECDFQHILVDAGTGFSAAGLIKGLNDARHKAMVHVLLLADDKKTFQKKLYDWLGDNPENYCCFYPTTAKSFGSVNQTIRLEIKKLAREEGILADPVYSAKLFYEARRYIISNQLEGNVLIIHSGGTLTMAGFEY